MEYLAQNILYSWFYLIYTKLLLEKVGYSWEYPGINMAPPGRRRDLHHRRAAPDAMADPWVDDFKLASVSDMTPEPVQ